MKPHAPKGAFPWALYDLANTIYSMNVVTLFFSQWVTVDRGREDLWYSLFYGASMLAVAFTLPYLGDWSDRAGRRLRFLALFTGVCIAGTAALGGVTRIPGTWGLVFALSLFALANYAFQGGLVFYNALLPEVSTAKNRGRISGLGVALGYLGSFLGMFLVVPFVDGTLPIINREVGFLDPGGREAAFLPTAILFLVFALPIFLFVKEPPRPHQPRPRFREVWADILLVLRDMSRYPGVRWFLIANLLILDAVHTAILFMAVYAQKVMGLPDSVKVVFFMLATVPAILGSFVAGWLADRFGARKVFVITAWTWALGTFVVAATSSTTLFYVMGGVFGMLLGSLWTSTRPLLLALTPEGEEGRMFGIYAFCNKAAAVIGPQVWGVTVLLGGGLGPAKYRLALAILGGVCALGALVLAKVPDRREAPA